MRHALSEPTPAFLLVTILFVSVTLLYARHTTGGTSGIISSVLFELKYASPWSSRPHRYSPDASPFADARKTGTYPCTKSIVARQGFNRTLGIGNFWDLYARLIRCPIVGELEMSFSQGGCVIAPRDNFAFQWHQGDRFPTLENLTISNYDWDQKSPLQHSNLHSVIGKSNVVPNVERWREAMDWSQLKKLNMDLPPAVFLDAFHGKLTGLKELTWRPRWGRTWGGDETMCDFSEEGDLGREKLEDFIVSLPPLRKVQIGGTGALLNLSRILEQHGSNLEHLGFNELEGDCRWCTNMSRPTFSTEEIRTLKQSVPNLTSLSLDLGRNGSADSGEWPWEKFRLLAAFPHVSKITVHLDLEDRSVRRRVQRCYSDHMFDSWLDWDEQAWMRCSIPALLKPILDEGEALEIFKHMRDHEKGRPVEKVTLWTGNVGRRFGGGMRAHYHSEYNSPVEVECERHHEGFDGRDLGACCFWPGYQSSWTERHSRVCEDRKACREERYAYEVDRELRRRERAQRLGIDATADEDEDEYDDDEY